MHILLKFKKTNSHANCNQDLDFLVLSPRLNPLALQMALRRLQPAHFSLKKPRRLNAKFMLLKYRIPGTTYKIKIDLLHSTEAKVEIPQSLRPIHFNYVNNLPVAPLYFILYHKLLGWELNLHAREPYKRYKKAPLDHMDIIKLCNMAKRQGVRPLSKSHMGRLYLHNFRQRANRFMDHYGNDTKKVFQQVGFHV
jgi:hypothetical protein